VLALAAALKRENPARTAAQVARVLRASGGWSPSERTLQRHFARLELDTRPDGSPPAASARAVRLICVPVEGPALVPGCWTVTPHRSTSSEH
jgi:hypothetical protein